MKKYEIKQKLKSISKGTWIFLGIMTFFVILAIALLLLAMHLCGYNLITWLMKFGGWLILVIVILLVIIATVLFSKFSKGR